MTNSGLKKQFILFSIFILISSISISIADIFFSKQNALIVGIVISLLQFFICIIYISRKSNKLTNIFNELKQENAKITGIIKELSLEANYLLSSSQEQSQAIHSSAAAVEETSQMTSRTEEQMQESTLLVNEINNEAKNGTSIMQQLSKAIESIASISDSLSKIEDRITQINVKTDIINEIVFNTRLLSFNASVEAERAGTAGAGFAVVAQEIGNLANMSGEASVEIKKLLTESHKEVSSIVADTKEKVVQGQTITEKTTQSFLQIVNRIENINKGIDLINTATKEQNIGIRQTSSAMNKMDNCSQENINVAKNTGSYTEQIKESNVDLNHIINNLGSYLLGDSSDHSSNVISNDFIPWSNDLSVNINSIDDQHKTLVNLINDLYKSINTGLGTSSSMEILNELINYTQSHFSYEESLLQKCKYPDFNQHKQIHEKLIDTVVKLKNDFNSGNASFNRDLMNFLKSWITNHILETDKKYISHMKSHKID